MENNIETLKERIQEIAQDAKKSALAGLFETISVMKQTVVIKFIRMLGYDDTNPFEVRTDEEYSGITADYTIYKNRTPLLIILCTEWGTSLEEIMIKSIPMQNKIDIPFIILTNGDKFLFFASEEKEGRDRRPCLEFNLSSIKESALSLLISFHKESNFSSVDTLLNHMRGKEKTDLIKQALRRELDHPSDDFIKILIKNARVTNGNKITPKLIEEYKNPVKNSISSLLKELANKVSKEEEEEKEKEKKEEKVVDISHKSNNANIQPITKSLEKIKTENRKGRLFDVIFEVKSKIGVKAKAKVTECTARGKCKLKILPESIIKYSPDEKRLSSKKKEIIEEGLKNGTITQDDKNPLFKTHKEIHLDSASGASKFCLGTKSSNGYEAWKYGKISLSDMVKEHFNDASSL